MTDHERGTGRTSQQMRDAPHGAWFFVPSGMQDYASSLARYLGREDLTIIPQHNLRRDYFAGRRLPGFVIDHAIKRLTSAQRDAVEYAQPLIGRD